MGCAYWRKRNEEKLNKRTNGKKLFLYVVKDVKRKYSASKTGLVLCLFLDGCIYCICLEETRLTNAIYAGRCG